MKLDAIKRKASLAGFKIKTHSPEIMVIAGVIGTVVAAVMACKETLELADVLDEGKEAINDIKEAHATIDNERYPEEVYKKDLTIQTVKNVVAVGKLYAPSVCVGAASIALIFGSNEILRKRNASLAAAYATLDSMYRRYRKNVKDTFGEDIDRDMRYGVKHEKVEEIVVDDNGKERKVKKIVDVMQGDNSYSDYARFFDEGCPSWDEDPNYNLSYLKGIERYCTDKLISQGYLFLNDVYRSLGMEPSIAGQTVGWIYDSKNPVGDNYVDFGIYNVKRERNVAFVNGYENVILLDFNVDGDILHNPKLNMHGF